VRHRTGEPKAITEPAKREKVQGGQFQPDFQLCLHFWECPFITERSKELTALETRMPSNVRIKHDDVRACPNALVVFPALKLLKSERLYSGEARRIWS